MPIGIRREQIQAGNLLWAVVYIADEVSAWRVVSPDSRLVAGNAPNFRGYRRSQFGSRIAGLKVLLDA